VDLSPPRHSAPVAAEHLATFTPYLTSGYVFVVSRITALEELLKEFPGYTRDSPG
jgi:hypothetical protein